MSETEPLSNQSERNVEMDLSDPWWTIWDSLNEMWDELEDDWYND